MSFFGYNVQPLIWRTKEVESMDKMEELAFFMMGNKAMDKFAKKILPKYISKECPMKCLFCCYVEGIEYDDIPTRCGGTGNEVSPDGFCHLFTPDDEVYEVAQ